MEPQDYLDAAIDLFTQGQNALANDRPNEAQAAAHLGQLAMALGMSGAAVRRPVSADVTAPLPQ